MEEKSCCESCHFAEFQYDSENGDQIFCHEKPPVPIPVPSQNQITGQVGISIQIIFPMVKPELWCGKWKPNRGEGILRLDS